MVNPQDSSDDCNPQGPQILLDSGGLLRYTNNMTKNNSNAQRTLRRTQAEERQAERSKRTDEQQIAKLDAKLGKGVGARKERDLYS